MCRISVIVPLYNGEKTIARCLDSLIAQELCDMEILVINDGSTDRGPDIAAEYMERDKRIRMISQKNGGLGAARNTGIREAAGNYVGFVDCDDFTDVKMFASMVDVLERTGAPVAICQEKNVYAENGKIEFINETKYPDKEVKVYPSQKVLEWLLNYTYMSLNSMCYKVVEKRVFLENNIRVPENYRHAEDMVTSIGILTNVEKVAIIPQSMYYYVHTKGSLTYSYSLRHAEDVYLDWRDAMKYLRKGKFEGITDNFSLGMCFASLKQLNWAIDKKERTSSQGKVLRQKWNAARKQYGWRPDFKGLDTPILHKLKVYVAYFKLCGPVFLGIKCLRWIPFFKYMA